MTARPPAQARALVALMIVAAALAASGGSPLAADDGRSSAFDVGGAPPPDVSAAGQPAGAVVLFDGADTTCWEGIDGSRPIRWPVEDGALVVCPGCGDIRTLQAWGDFRLHLEFSVPLVAEGASEQDRGNSGVYLQERYELQVLDSFGRPLADQDDAAAVYGVKDADANAALPPAAWQTYDVTFRASRWSDGSKRENARLTLIWNGVTVHDWVELPHSTAGGNPEGPEPGPILLQDHHHPVRYRTIWIEPWD